MIAARPIPIQNLYYLLAYAWDALEDVDEAPVGVEDDACTIVDLFAAALCIGAERLFRRGLEQGYIEHEEHAPTVRGRICWGKTLKAGGPFDARVTCAFDERSRDIHANDSLRAR